MTITDQVIKDIVKRVIKGMDYRIKIVSLINASFLQFVINFFKQIVDLKLKNKGIEDWYKKEFLNSHLSKDDIAINSGLNMKTITNMYGSATKEVVIDAANEHYDTLYHAIACLIDNEEDLALTLTIKFKGVSVDLTINETLIAINTLAVKRAALRGGAWSAAGKKTEKVLMKALCALYSVPESNIDEDFIRDDTLNVSREVDFYLLDNYGKKYLCEVKLMGKGNPESADAIFARNSDVFVADTLSQQNRDQADELDVAWVALRDKDGYKRIKNAFEKYSIPYTDYNGEIDQDLDRILSTIMD